MKPFLKLILLLGVITTFSCENSKDNNTADNSTEENTEPKKPTNIILMVGDGMGLTQITAGMIENDNTLHLEDFPYIGLIKTTSSDNLVTDSAAGATAFSTGKKTYNGAIGVDADTTSVETILEYLGNGKYATGLIATSSITHATPASFYAHQSSRGMEEEIAHDMLAAPVDLFIGGGRDFFTKRKDELNLLDSLSAKDFKVYEEFDSIDFNSEEKIAGLIADKALQSILDGRDDVLSKATEKSLEYLSKNENFFLSIEGSQIDWAGHSNDSEGIITEMIDFDKAVGKVLDFAEKDGNTLVIVTADHETGGYSINGKDDEGKIDGKFTTDYHTATMIPVFAYGPGAENFSGIYENTAIYEKMMELTEE